MKLIKFKVLPILALLSFSCTNNNEQSNSKASNTIVIDSTQKVGIGEVEKPQNKQDIFWGEYLIGDGGAFIVPVNGLYELRNEKGENRETLYFQGKEKDTLSVYVNKDKSIIFKMNPGHKAGMYYEIDEQWPVSYLKPIQKEETEKEETDRMFRQRHIEDSIAYTQLDMYDGTYLIKTESEQVNATLKLHYNGDQTFNYEWVFDVANEEANCKGNRKGILTMDRTQHGFDRSESCNIHFNFNGYWNNGYVVEMDFKDQSKCPDLIGECTFSGTYINSK